MELKTSFRVWIFGLTCNGYDTNYANKITGRSLFSGSRSFNRHTLDYPFGLT